MIDKDLNANRAYVLMATPSKKEQGYSNKTALKGLKHDSAIGNIDFLHGAFDLIIYSTE